MELIDVNELARRLSIPRTWIYDRTRQGASDPIPHLKLGKYVRFDWESPELRQWVKSHLCPSYNRDNSGSLNRETPATD